MECYKEWDEDGYEVDLIRRMEDTLLWAEHNCQEPVINCLEGCRNTESYNGDKSVRIEERNSQSNLRWMRMITTLGLTHSDGYVLFSDPNQLPSEDHLHNYYDFWMRNLGMPLTEQATNYENYEQIYIRYFEKGFVIYNGSEEAVDISAVDTYEQVSTGKMDYNFMVGPYDGEIFLKVDF